MTELTFEVAESFACFITADSFFFSVFLLLLCKSVLQWNIQTTAVSLSHQIYLHGWTLSSAVNVFLSPFWQYVSYFSREVKKWSVLWKSQHCFFLFFSVGLYACTCWTKKTAKNNPLLVTEIWEDNKNEQQKWYRQFSASTSDLKW